VREHLQNLAALLRENGEGERVAKVEAAAVGSDQEFDVFLRSNDLWGGSGSMADSAGVFGLRNERRRQIEHALVQLGTEQI